MCLDNMYDSTPPREEEERRNVQRMCAPYADPRQRSVQARCGHGYNTFSLLLFSGPLLGVWARSSASCCFEVCACVHVLALCVDLGHHTHTHTHTCQALCALQHKTEGLGNAVATCLTSISNATCPLMIQLFLSFFASSQRYVRKRTSKRLIQCKRAWREARSEHTPPREASVGFAHSSSACAAAAGRSLHAAACCSMLLCAGPDDGWCARADPRPRFALESKTTQNRARTTDTGGRGARRKDMRERQVVSSRKSILSRWLLLLLSAIA